MNMRNLLLALGLACLPASLSAMSDAPPMPDWMTGAWAHQDGDEWADEYWTPPRGDLMIGAARSGKAERLLFWEHMRIVKEDDGAVVFWAVSGDQKAVRFVATVSSEDRILFENAAHDYPQRIEYWREGKILKAEISLLDGSKAVQFSYRLMGS